ncbi:MAG: N(G),N(G)-dimethylarginine dimethylaminohydrolase [Gemmataceae bacterium]
MEPVRKPKLVALTREVSPTISRCELTHLAREPIDVGLAREQHRRYEDCLTGLGCTVHRLPAAPDLPDSVFVEDAAVVLDELAVITRPGAGSRRAEPATAAEALKPFRELRFVEAPATLDGGDVLCLGKRVFVGLSGRSNRAAVDQLRGVLKPHGYEVAGVELTGCLHLKTAVTKVAPGTLLVNRSWVDPAVFGDVTTIDVDPAEPFGANALLVGEIIVYPAAFPRTRELLEGQGLRVRAVEVSELAKAEGGVTCCCILV